ncbi:DUF898 domain-containing protein [Natronospirillum operosum]|uniref:DUF898 domain-containing protein n=1 Tax=Natronospirillum operosum TaxID=2759953 RepID=A0A4Z0WJE2_9GAMM|nr:YjgN family protein [Natronospirillum operosum]TGG95986.1 DUF898 domain-containing protein [Natronospirillum operosum]
MSDMRYNIIFTGELQHGHEVEQVKERFAKAFSLALDRVDQLFSAARTTLKRDLDAEAAHHYRSRLATLGMKVELEAQGAAGLSLEPLAADSRQARSAAPGPEAGGSQAGSSAPQADSAAASPRMAPFRFHGDGREYFGIWIVNILLSIVTLGIYSAWAKVRNKQYFYGNTEVEDATFEYTADPKRILVGRIIALVFFIAYTVLGELSLTTAIIAWLALLAFMPWAVRQALRFNARYSSYRNVPFQFTGTLGGAFMAFIVWPLIGTITLGLLFPLMLQRQQHYIIGQHAWGTAPFSFAAPVSAYYVMALKLVGLMVFGGLILWGLAVANAPLLVLSTLGIALYLGLLAVFNVRMANLKYNFTSLTAGQAEHGFEANWEDGSYFKLILVNTLATVFTLGLFTPWAKVRAARYAAEHTEAVVDGDLDRIAAVEQERTSAIAEGVGDLFDLDVGA